MYDTSQREVSFLNDVVSTYCNSLRRNEFFLPCCAQQPIKFNKMDRAHDIIIVHSCWSTAWTAQRCFTTNPHLCCPTLFIVYLCNFIIFPPSVSPHHYLNDYLTSVSRLGISPLYTMLPARAYSANSISQVCSFIMGLL